MTDAERGKKKKQKGKPYLLVFNFCTMLDTKQMQNVCFWRKKHTHKMLRLLKFVSIMVTNSQTLNTVEAL